MVGLKPPLPRTYPVFRFATVLATLLLFFTFATNFMAPRMVRTAVPYGIGGYGGGGAEPEAAMEAAPEEPAAPALEAPAAKEPSVEEPAVPVAPAPAPTEMSPTFEDSVRIEPTTQPSEKSGVQEVPPGETFAQQTAPGEAEQAQRPARPISASVQIVLAGVAILSGLIALLLRYSAIRKWRAKAK
jgi:hypothetical protein